MLDAQGPEPPGSSVPASGKAEALAHATTTQSTVPTSRQRDWRRLRDAGVAILAWLTVTGVVLWGLAHVIGTLLTVIVAAILAYALAPAVKHLERFMPRAAAIALVYVGILTTLSGLIYLIAITAVGQVSMLLIDMQSLLSPTVGAHSSPLVNAFRAMGLSDSQIHGAANRLMQQVQGLTGDAVTVAAGVFDAVVRTVVVGVLSIYLLKDGPLMVQWLRNNTPISHRPRVVFGVETLDTVVGGYIRGQLTLSALIGLLVGGGMWAFHVPYAVFLGVLAFVLEFVPLVGVFISGAVCVILALTVGWLTAVFVLAYFVIIHFIEGDFVGPRIMSKAVGLHPAVSILALFAGAELFGVWGALFAAPVAGLVQAVMRALWMEWRASHPEQFPTGHTVTPMVRVVPVTHGESAQQVGVELHGGVVTPVALSLVPIGPPVAPDPSVEDYAADLPQTDGSSSPRLPSSLHVVGDPSSSYFRLLSPLVGLAALAPKTPADPAEADGLSAPSQRIGSPITGVSANGAPFADVGVSADAPLLPEVETWRPRPTTRSFYEQFAAAVNEDVHVLKGDIMVMEKTLEHDVGALEDDVSRLRDATAGSDAKPQRDLDPSALDQPPEPRTSSC